MYSFAIFLYMLGVIIVSPFHRKARALVRGHWNTFRILRQQIDRRERYVWFHAASLGEFEQGRPLMERFRREHPEYKILLTFFSPSGYEVRKNYEGADVICYLPFDTPGNVMSFFRLVRPEMAFFIKYEFWQNFIKACNHLRIPVYSVSSIFRPNKIYFRWYGRGYANVLRRVTHFFVQDEESATLLHGLGITADRTTIVGDTRFDRVLDICHQAKELPLVEAFVTPPQPSPQGEGGNSPSQEPTSRSNSDEKSPSPCGEGRGGVFVLVAGSSWAPDEDLLIPYFNHHPGMKLILAPHVISEEHLHQIEHKLDRPYLRYTEATPENIQQADCLIINCFGLLSSIYRYGQLAYVGGGFGVGIHNVPEAAVYGIPVIIGPNNKGFREAQDLLRLGGCHEVTDADTFNTLLDRFTSNPAFLQQSGKACGAYISSNAGAVDAIWQHLNL